MARCTKAISGCWKVKWTDHVSARHLVGAQYMLLLFIRTAKPTKTALLFVSANIS